MRLVFQVWLGFIGSIENSPMFDGGCMRGEKNLWFWKNVEKLVQGRRPCAEHHGLQCSARMVAECLKVVKSGALLIENCF
jgi:hypothetical protein